MWEFIDPNYVKRFGGFAISYNPNVQVGIVGAFDDVFCPAKAADDPQETALIDIENDKWMVLKGDHRKAYEQAAKHGLVACKAYYNKKKRNCKSRWDNAMIEGEAGI